MEREAASWETCKINESQKRKDTGWIAKGYLKKEVEALIFAAQEQMTAKR